MCVSAEGEKHDGAKTLQEISQPHLPQLPSKQPDLPPPPSPPPSSPGRPVHYSNYPERLDRMEKTKRRSGAEQEGRLEVLEGQEGVMGMERGGIFFLQRQQMG